MGALSYLLRDFDVPVYGTALTLAIARHRLAEHGLLDQADLRPYRPGDEIAIGCFQIEPIRVTHSIADGIGLAIETPVGTVVHTGDFKLDPNPVDRQQPDYARFTALGERGVLCLCSDSTNVGRAGRTGSETEVGAALRGRFDSAAGRIIVATFASHIHRIQQVMDLAAACSRKLGLLGRSMAANVAVAAELGYLHVPEGVLLPLEELADLPADHQVILSTGSQGEQNSALSLMAAGEHKHFTVGEGDLVIFSSRVIPGNERVVVRLITRSCAARECCARTWPSSTSVREPRDISGTCGPGPTRVLMPCTEYRPSSTRAAGTEAGVRAERSSCGDGVDWS